MQLQDYLKLTYQHTFGAEHLIQDINKNFDILKDEYDILKKSINTELSYMNIGNNLVRFPLQSISTYGLSLNLFHQMFLYTAQLTKSNFRQYVQNIEVLQQFISEHKPAYLNELQQYLDNLEEPVEVLSHSVIYKNTYAPAYRLIHKSLLDYLSAFTKIEELLQKHEYVTIAIDGCSGSGKSTLADILSNIFDADVMHMDDFFLPQSKKTIERLSQPGGNVDYERFYNEVIIHRNEDKITYMPFDCALQTLKEPISQIRKHLLIVEGVYSMHPYFKQPYDLSIFLTTDSQTQLQRIRNRSGEVLLKRYIDEWIPLENIYFETNHLMEHADLCIYQKDE